MNKLHAIPLVVICIIILASCNNTSKEAPPTSTAHYYSPPMTAPKYPLAQVPALTDTKTYGPLEHTDYDIWQVARNHQLWGPEEAFRPKQPSFKRTLPSRVLVYTNGEFVVMPSEYEGSVFDKSAIHFGGKPTVGDMGLTFGLSINDASFGDPASTSKRTSVWDEARKRRQTLPN